MGQRARLRAGGAPALPRRRGRLSEHPHRDAIVGEFTAQSAGLDASPVHRSDETLGTLIELLPAEPGSRWLEAACGSALVARELAPRVGSVHGVDVTPAQVERARAGAAAAGLVNATFEIGDATALPLEDASFDGAVTRFSVHHVPVPARLVAELARVVRPGGWVAVGDHVTADGAGVAAWHNELERLRDPSHWACLPPARLRELGARAGLELVRERTLPISLDWEEWLARGTGGAGSRALIEQALTGRPGGDDVFRVRRPRGAPARLGLRYWLGLWRIRARDRG